MENVHLVKDESIGGIQREFIEVDRKAEVGDYVWVSKMDGAPVNEIAKVINEDYDGDNSREAIQLDVEINHEDLLLYVGNDDSFAVLEPTDIVHIDVTRYQLVERKAEVGDQIMIVSADRTFDNYDNGDIMTVQSAMNETVYVRGGTCVGDGEYSVLIPVDSEPTPDIYDLMANLVTRVAALETENKRIKQDLGWYEMGPGRIANLRNSVSDLKHSIQTLGESFEQDKHESDEFADEMRRKVGELVRSRNSLEGQLRDTQNNVQTFAELAETAKELTEANTKDIAFLDERTYTPVKPTKSAEEILHEISKILAESGGAGA
jgi:hypothetical protein